MIASRLLACILSAFICRSLCAESPATPLPALPKDAELAFSEDWSRGRIDSQKWYSPRKTWGEGNHGVVPENIRIERDRIGDREQNVLVCEAHGDLYDGPIAGWRGEPTRVGGLLVTTAFFASGRYEVVMKVGKPEGGRDAITLPIGSVPAIWTYAYRYVTVPPLAKDRFTAKTPLYNPLMQIYGGGANEYWSEIDFPELGKQGDFHRGLYNTFCQNRHDWRVFDIPSIDDHEYHTYTTDWRTTLKPLPEVRDEQVVEKDGLWWIQDKAVPFDSYLGNPLKRLGKDRYAVYWGLKAEHWLDGVKVGENVKHVPAMAAQLNLGVWLPKWAGPAPWKRSRVCFARVRIWRYCDPGDVYNVLIDDIPDNIGTIRNEG
jgi:hypothetical protein